MKIAGKQISPKIFIVLGVVLVVVIGTMISKAKEQREIDERLAQIEAEKEKNQSQNVPETERALTFEEQLQADLREKYGEPPEGFKWDYAGNPVAVSDDTISYEDVTYTYIRALSIMDLSTAQRYSSKSMVVETYEDYYGAGNAAYADYYNSFLRKQFRFSITSLEVNSIDSTAVFADGTVVVTLNISLLDLTDKDFWEKDKEDIFNTMMVYDDTELDSVKKEQYVYDYIYQAYEDGVVGKRSMTVELVLSKENGGGWLVSDDSELNFALKYESGVDVAQYIFNAYREWHYEQDMKRD